MLYCESDVQRLHSPHTHKRRSNITLNLEGSSSSRESIKSRKSTKIKPLKPLKPLKPFKLPKPSKPSKPSKPLKLSPRKARVAATPTPEINCTLDAQDAEYTQHAQASVHTPLAQATHTSEPPYTRLLQNEQFPALFRNYVESLVCKTVGDAHAYMKHLMHEKNASNTSALAQLQAIQYFDRLRDALREIYEKFEMLGYERIVTMCTSLQQSTSLPRTSDNFWSICTFTGMPCNKLLHIANSVKIHVKFHAFVTALWLCQHMQSLEQHRIERFLAQQQDTTFMSETITAYLRSDDAFCMQEVYQWAFLKCFATFDATLATFTEVVRRVKNIDACSS